MIETTERRVKPARHPEMGKALRKFWAEAFPDFEVLSISGDAIIPASLSLPQLETLLGIDYLRYLMEAKSQLKLTAANKQGKRKLSFSQKDTSEALDVLLTSRDDIKSVKICYEQFSSGAWKERARFDYYFREVRQQQIELTKYRDGSYEVYGLNNPVNEEKSQSVHAVFRKNGTGMIVPESVEIF